MGKIKCSLCLKQKRAKKFIFAPEITLRVERSNTAQNPNFCAYFLNACLLPFPSTLTNISFTLNINLMKS